MQVITLYVRFLIGKKKGYTCDPIHVYLLFEFVGLATGKYACNCSLSKAKLNMAAYTVPTHRHYWHFKRI